MADIVKIFYDVGKSARLGAKKKKKFKGSLWELNLYVKVP